MLEVRGVEGVANAALDAHFPSSVGAQDYIDQGAEKLYDFGFRKENAIACISVCRDEITRRFYEMVMDKWGELFNMTGLGGLLIAGRTALDVAWQHAPTIYDRERVILYALTHIAIGQNGRIGERMRAGQDKPSMTCGALAALQQELASGKPDLKIYDDDAEQALLKRRLDKLIGPNERPDLVTMTKTALMAINEDIKHLVDVTLDPARTDLAIFTGVQIHMPGQDRVWPGMSYAVIEQKRHNLTFSERAK